MTETKMSTVMTDRERQDAEALIDHHGRNAAGEAFIRAIEAWDLGDDVAIERWALVAAEVMMIQRTRTERSEG